LKAGPRGLRKKGRTLPVRKSEEGGGKKKKSASPFTKRTVVQQVTRWKQHLASADPTGGARRLGPSKSGTFSSLYLGPVNKASNNLPRRDGAFVSGEESGVELWVKLASKKTNLLPFGADKGKKKTFHNLAKYRLLLTTPQLDGITVIRHIVTRRGTNLTSKIGKEEVQPLP